LSCDAARVTCPPRSGFLESIVVGLTLLAGEGVSVALFVAVFLSNLPEAMAATSGLAATGVRSGRIMAMWALVTAVSGVAALAGYGLLGSAPPAAEASSSPSQPEPS
jgi:ZIP family zinc transporter